MLVKVIQLEDRFDREMDQAQKQIAQLTKELNGATDRINELERREVERLNDLNQSATYKRPLADKNHLMARKIAAISAGNNYLIFNLIFDQFKTYYKFSLCRKVSGITVNHIGCLVLALRLTRLTPPSNQEIITLIPTVSISEMTLFSSTVT